MIVNISIHQATGSDKDNLDFRINRFKFIHSFKV